MVYSIDIAGNNVGILVRLVEELNDPETAIIELPNVGTYQTLTDTDRDVTISYDGTDVWYGKLTGYSKNKGQINSVSHNRAYEISRRTLITGTYNPSRASKILSDIASAMGIASSWDAATDPKLNLEFSKAKAWDVINYLTSITNNDFWTTTGPLTLHIGSRGSNKGAKTIIDTESKNVERSQNYNSVYVRGVNNLGKIIYGNASTGAKDRPIVYNDKLARSSSELQSLAQKYLNEINTDTKTIKVIIPESEGYNVYPGDTVNLTDPDVGLSGNYKVYKTEKVYGEVRLWVGRKPTTTSDQLNYLRNMEDFGIFAIEQSSTPISSLQWVSDITFSVVDHDTASWTAGTISFADNSTLSINAGNSGDLANGWHYVYWVEGNSDLQVTSSHSTATGTDRAIISRLFVSSDANQDIAFFPTNAYGESVIVDNIGPSAVDVLQIAADAVTAAKIAVDAVYEDAIQTSAITTTKIDDDAISTPKLQAGSVVAAKISAAAITAEKIQADAVTAEKIAAGAVISDKITTSQITAKDFRTEYGVGDAGGPAGIRFTPNEIAGYSGGTTKTFYLQASDGKAYAAAGAVRMDNLGINIIDDSGTNYIIFRKANEDIKGSIYKHADDYMVIRSYDYDVRIWGNLSSLGNESYDLGSIDLKWNNGYIKNIHASNIQADTHLILPTYSGGDPASPTEGEVWFRSDL